MQQDFSKDDIDIRIENATQEVPFGTTKVSEDIELPVRQAIIPRPGVICQISTLVWRTGLEMFRNPSLIILHWLLALGMGIFVGCVFWQVGLDTSGAQNRAGGLVFALSFFAFSSLTTVDLIFHEKRVVTSEVRSGYYHPWSYYTAKLILDGILLRFLPTLLYAAAFYPMMGLSSEPKAVALFLMTLGTFAVAIGALSLAITVLSSTAGQASFAMNLILLISLLNSGFFVNIEAMADWISWLHYLSPFFYSYSILVINEISNLLFTFQVR
jgi:ABC-type multidrug transport system permease subunit